MFDAKLFALINALAGRAAWLDTCGRFLAVYGLLAVLLLAVTVFWWPRLAARQRRGYGVALLLAGAGCLLCFGLEWLLVTHVIHHDLRTRPFDARWATLLITAESALSFPAWPAALALALLPATLRVSRCAGWVMAVLCVLLGVSLVFVGVNYPLDVLVGGLLGIAIGETGALLAIGAERPRARAWQTILAVWAVLLVGTAAVSVSVKHGSVEYEAKSTRSTQKTAVNVPPPPAVLAALLPAAQPGVPSIDAATNGHLLVAEARVLLPSATTTRAEVDSLARRVSNAMFSCWPQLNLLTVSVNGTFRDGGKTHYGRLFTTTVAREAWPVAGFAAAQKLPGKIFYNTRVK